MTKFNAIIDSFKGDSGLGLGSQVSQLIALAVLDDLDHFIKEKLGIKYYVRYMDDFILIHPDKEYLKYCLEEIRKKLEEIHLELNDKTCIVPLSQGVKLLQWRFLVTDSGAIVMKMSKKKCSRERRKLKKIHQYEMEGKYPKGSTEVSFRSWMANADRGDSFYEKKKMTGFYYGLEGQQNGRHLQKNFKNRDCHQVSESRDAGCTDQSLSVSL